MNEKEQAEQIWSQVVCQPVGVKLRTADPHALHALLVEARTQAGDPDLYQFTLQVKGGEVWIIRRRGLPEVKTDGAFQPLEE